MAASLIHQLRTLGFKRAGRYAGGVFSLDSDWRTRQVVYVWIHREGQAVSPTRVGIACGTNGFGRRYDHYNKWLAGRFKPDDAREQKVRSLFLERLGNGTEVWATEVPDKQRALALETSLRSLWGEALGLDLMVRGSWAKQRMNEWRAEGRPSVRPAPATIGHVKQAIGFEFPLILRPPLWIRSASGGTAVLGWTLFFSAAFYWAAVWMVCSAILWACKALISRKANAHGSAERGRKRAGASPAILRRRR